MRWVLLLLGFALAGAFERGTLPFYVIAGGSLYIFFPVAQGQRSVFRTGH